MSREKQIEEMARGLAIARNCICIGRAKPCNECDWREGCLFIECSRTLVDAGYRKASDVAREIFAEIGKRFETLLGFYPCNGELEDAKSFLDYHWKHIERSIMRDYDAELKKKYTEEGK